MSPPTKIYRAVLGSAWNTLPEPIRRFHEEEAPRPGRIAVVHGQGVLAALIRFILRMPKAGADQPATITIASAGAQEVWHRNFGDCDFKTFQWLDKDLHLRERVGPLTLVFGVEAVAGGLDYRLLAVRPLPARFLPRLLATERLAPDGATLVVSVHVHLPAGSLLIAYDGAFKI